MDFLKKQEGFTIIEVILASLILVIIIFAFMTISTSSITGIFGAGRKSSALFEAQDYMDNSIDAGPGQDVVEETTHEIGFNGTQITVSGEVKGIDYNYENHSGTLYYFYPDPTGN